MSSVRDTSLLFRVVMLLMAITALNLDSLTSHHHLYSPALFPPSLWLTLSDICTISYVLHVTIIHHPITLCDCTFCKGAELVGKRICMYSYGSGSMASLYRYVRYVCISVCPSRLHVCFCVCSSECTCVSSPSCECRSVSLSIWQFLRMPVVLSVHPHLRECPYIRPYYFINDSFCHSKNNKIILASYWTLHLIQFHSIQSIITYYQITHSVTCAILCLVSSCLSSSALFSQFCWSHSWLWNIFTTPYERNGQDIWTSRKSY